MEIISHRGYWKKENEKNTLISFERSFSMGYGIETDIRDYRGKLVISHDLPCENSIPVDILFKQYLRYSKSTLALNIKADGLQTLLQQVLQQYMIENYFVFDMSIPDTIEYLDKGFNVFSRQSEYEQNIVFYDRVQGIWLDSFNQEWYDKNLIENHLKSGKKVAIVSAELHKRKEENLWSFLKKTKLYEKENLILCTDKPLLASKYF